MDGNEPSFEGTDPRSRQDPPAQGHPGQEHFPSPALSLRFSRVRSIMPRLRS